MAKKTKKPTPRRDNSRLAPGSLITQEVADALDAQLEVAEEAQDLAENTQASLASFIETHANQITDDEAVDFWGDGRAKRRAGCTLPPGWMPPRMEPRRSADRAERRAQKVLDRAARKERLPPQANADERRHPNAHVSPGLMRQAENRRAANSAAWDMRRTQGIVLNQMTYTAMRPTGVPLRADYVVDAFGDGLAKPIAAITLPPLLQWIKLQQRG